MTNLTKRQTVDDDVLTIIRAMDWQDGGTVGVLMCGQLDRPLYERVNKALEALGGKWNRSRKGHVFPTSPLPQIGGVLENGMLVTERDGFFETPPEVVARMVELIRPYGRILEPSAGLGAICRCLPVKQDQIFCIEKNRQRAAELAKNGYAVKCCDFLEYQAPGMFDTVFMNPPFGALQDADHICHAYECLAHGGALVSVMSEGAFFRMDRRAKSFREWLDLTGGESEKLPPDSFTVKVRLVVIHKLAVPCNDSGQFKLF